MIIENLKHWLLDYAEGLGSGAAIVFLFAVRMVQAAKKTVTDMEAKAKAAEANKIVKRL